VYFFSCSRQGGAGVYSAFYGEALGLGVVVLSITYLSLIVGELVPKRLALNSPELIASRVAGPMRVLSRVAGLLVSLLTVSTDVVLRVLQVRPSQEAAISEEEVRVLIAKGTEAGVIEEAERELVESAFELGETRVEELMTPRPLVTWLDADQPPDAAWQKSVESSHSYYPVCRGELDHVVGCSRLENSRSGCWLGSELSCGTRSAASVRPGALVGVQSARAVQTRRLPTGDGHR
jgi:putative hemolysin